MAATYDIACFPGTMENQWAYVLLHFTPRHVYAFDGELWSKPFVGASAVLSAEELPQIPIVVLAPLNGDNVQGAISLDEFGHPAECVYLFGPDDELLMPAHLGSREYSRVYIKTDTTDQMWSWVAAAVTLFDRRSKGG